MTHNGLIIRIYGLKLCSGRQYPPSSCTYPLNGGIFNRIVWNVQWYTSCRGSFYLFRLYIIGSKKRWIIEHSVRCKQNLLFRPLVAGRENSQFSSLPNIPLHPLANSNDRDRDQWRSCIAERPWFLIGFRYGFCVHTVSIFHKVYRIWIWKCILNKSQTSVWIQPMQLVNRASKINNVEQLLTSEKGKSCELTN